MASRQYQEEHQGAEPSHTYCSPQLGVPASQVHLQAQLVQVLLGHLGLHLQAQLVQVKTLNVWGVQTLKPQRLTGPNPETSTFGGAQTFGGSKP